MCSSWCSAWTTGSPSRRCSAWSDRSMRPSRASGTKPRRTWTSRWWSAATSATKTSTGRCRRRRSSAWWTETSTAPTLKSPQRRTPTWTKCFRISLQWRSCPTKWAPTATARCPCSTATSSTESPPGTRSAKTRTHTGLWRRLRGDPACTVTWCTSRRRRWEEVRPRRRAASSADSGFCHGARYFFLWETWKSRDKSAELWRQWTVAPGACCGPTWAEGCGVCDAPTKNAVKDFAKSSTSEKKKKTFTFCYFFSNSGCLLHNEQIWIWMYIYHCIYLSVNFGRGIKTLLLS